MVRAKPQVDLLGSHCSLGGNNRHLYIPGDLMSDCILWDKAKNNKGYGMRWDGRKVVCAHRIAYQRAHPNEKISGKLIMHKCDIRNCVNPEHLVSGTAKQNTADMMNKGRGNWARGERSSKSKLTTKDVLFIRANYIRNKKPGLHWRFKVSKDTILDIVKKITWRHV